MAGCYDNPICRTGPPHYIDWRNRLFGIDYWAQYKSLKIRALSYLEELVHDVLSMDLLENVPLLDDMMQICLHELEDQVQVLIPEKACFTRFFKI
jgi:hypothetical protein